MTALAGWQAEARDGTARAVSTPVRLRAGEAFLVSTLPASVSAGDMLYLKTDQQRLTVWIGGEPAAVRGVADAWSEVSGCDLPWTAVALTPDMAGRSVRVAFSGRGSKPYVDVYAALLGQEGAVRLSLLAGAMPSLLLSLLIVLFALALFAFALLEARRYHERLPNGYLYLLLFVLLAGGWFCSETDLSGVAYLGSGAYLLFWFFGRLLLPVPFLLFLSSMQPAFRPLTRWLNTFLLLNCLLQAVLLVTGRMLLWMGLMLCHGAVGLGLLAVLYLVGSKKHPRHTLRGELTVGVCVTAGATLLSMVLFHFFPLTDSAAVLRYGVLALVIAMTATVLRANVDILMQSHQFEELRIHEEEYRIAARQSDKHVVRLDVVTREMSQSDDPAPLFGPERDIADMPETAIARKLVAEESVAEFRAFFQRMFAGQPSGTLSASLRGPLGVFAWYRADYTLIYDGRGRPLHAIISFYDITEQREKELAYQKWKQLYAEMPASGMNYFEYNLTRDALTGEAGEMLPRLPAEARGRLDQLVDYLAGQWVAPADEARFRVFFRRARLLEAFAHGVRSDQLEFRRLGEDNRQLWTDAGVQLISDPYSSDVQSFLLLKDVDEEKRNEMTVRARSDSDPLTGLLNRSAFEEQLTALLSTGAPEGVHALLMIDVDGFKRVNDSFGHQFGDRVLIDIAGNLRAMMRSDDLIGRIGGDEYMVCLKNVPERSGFLERRSAYICQALNKQFGSDVAISGSVGLALYPRDGRTFDTLYRKADKALYFAKHHGKNRFVFYNDDLLKGDTNAPSAQGALLAPADPAVVADAQREAVRTLLIVDDVEMNRDMLSEVFRDDYRLLTAAGGEECLELMQRSESMVSAVLLDLIMPGMDGLEVLRRMQGDVYMSSIPVIVISAAEETEYSLKAVELGATDYVSKPINPRLVRLRVQNAIHKRETEELRAQNRYLLVQKSEESRHQNELRYIAEHDPLTNICNKAAFYHKTRQMLDKEPQTTFVMIAFDIEKFRVINDIFGHEQGDRLLRYIAQRMQTLYTHHATYSRINADNFALCVPFHREQLEKRMAETEAELRDYDLPFELVLVYGLYIIDDRTLPVSIMHDRAEMAKRTVKGNYVLRFAFYDARIRESLLSELEIVNSMNAALLNRQFEIYLQPKCLLATGEIVGAEALVRWNHPTRGLLTPGAFVPIFEKNGFILKLDACVWEQVCALLRKWMDAHGGRLPIPVSMNVSRVNIYNPALVSTLVSLADRYGVPHRMLELEITESAYAQDPRQLSDLISELRGKGFPVEMDDFGNAYSSLNMLKEISVDLLKLDMRFLFGNDQDGRGGTILSSIVRMARYLSLPIVAEGVESVEQARFLLSIGCTVGQGFYYYKPMPVADFERLLESHPLKTVFDVADAYPEPAVRRVWSIDGDFSLMLNSIPCAASLCELCGDTLEVLRINDEYLSMTGDSIERLYRAGKDVRALTTEENYRKLLSMFREAYESQGVAEGEYRRLSEAGVFMDFHVKIRFISGDQVRSLFFITYQPIPEGGDRA
ncbi:MAG: EAL domain-containing protein [Clostridiales bacterium]|nr:EAL domain-containing protein [Clostridiales bacterium]